MPRTRILAATAALAAITLTGCGSSSSSVSAGQSPDTTAGAATPTTAAAGSGANLFTAGTVPAVDGATNLKAAPTMHAGIAPGPTTLIGKDLVVGTGQQATTTTGNVTVQYVGAFYQSGKVFDSSWSHGQAITFPLNGVIQGFGQGIVGMKIGGRRELVIPPSLGYGSQTSGAIPGNSTLIFVVDLVGIS